MQNDHDPRIVLTLDAGGTNLAFSGVQGNKQVVTPIVLATRGDQLEACLAHIINGFLDAQSQLAERAAAISIAFPGPADYPSGIIGDLTNLPAFRGGVALGPMLEDRFGIPVFINNDGDLFAYGEAIAGFLPGVNSLLETAGSPKRYRNLLGVTLGTGFGAGIVRNEELFLGDNSSAAEIWAIRNKLDFNCGAEEGVSIRGVKRTYSEQAHIRLEECPEPKEIHEIALGNIAGNRAAAIEAFRRMGEIAGDAIANAVTLIDGLVVIGGGLAGAYKLFLPALINELNGSWESAAEDLTPRIPMRAFNLEEADQAHLFAHGDVRIIQVPGSGRTLLYDRLMRTGVGISKLGTSHAVAIGAYAFALKALDHGASPVDLAKK